MQCAQLLEDGLALAVDVANDDAVNVSIWSGLSAGAETHIFEAMAKARKRLVMRCFWC